MLFNAPAPTHCSSVLAPVRKEDVLRNANAVITTLSLSYLYLSVLPSIFPFDWQTVYSSSKYSLYRFNLVTGHEPCQQLLMPGVFDYTTTTKFPRTTQPFCIYIACTWPSDATIQGMHISCSSVTDS